MAGLEINFSEKEFIVSKTDLAGKIIYGNEVFINISGYTESELLYQPHSILRHPDMPSAIFKFLWDKIKAREEIFAYVINKTKNDDYYWVFAHITPSLDDEDNLIGYHSVRRKPTQSALEKIKPLYRTLLDAERRGGMKASAEILNQYLIQQKVSYEEFILSF